MGSIMLGIGVQHHRQIEEMSSESPGMELEGLWECESSPETKTR